MKQTIGLFGVLRRLVGVTAFLALYSLCQLAQADVHTGSKKYLSACAGCHGASEDTPGFAPDLRRFQGDELAFLSIVKNGRPGTLMSGWQGMLSDAEIMSIRSYLKARSVTDARQAKDDTSQEGASVAR